MTSFVLKIIALVTMFCDHFGSIFFGHFNVLNLVGRIAFPIFAFQISEGYIHTKNLKKYFFRLFIFALASQIPFYLFLKDTGYDISTVTLNIFFTLLFGLISIILYDYLAKIDLSLPIGKHFKFNVFKLVGIFCVCMIAMLAYMLKVDYGFWGVIVIFSFYLFKNYKLAMIISFILLSIAKYTTWSILYGFNIVYLYNCIATAFPIIFISLYNGKQGPKIKYLLYLFYPLHLLLLYFIF